MKHIKNKIAISGALGRMGKILIKEIKKNKHIKLIYGLIPNKKIKNYCNNDKKYFSNKKNFFTTLNILENNKNISSFDTLIDFSTPCTTIKMIEYCIKYKKKMIIGTTGFNPVQINKIKQASKIIPILYSPNFSIGINVMHKIIQFISNVFGNNSDIEIIESHHKNKIDAPSGTALQLGKIISKSMNWDFNEAAIFSRHGNIGIRKNHTIGFSTIREGTTIGEHTVLFSNEYEKISIKHKAVHRSVFAKGALKAAIWIQNKKKGLYDMSDVLNNISIL